MNRLHVHGFIASDYFAGGAIQEAIPELAARLANGSLVAKAEYSALHSLLRALLHVPSMLF